MIGVRSIASTLVSAWGLAVVHATWQVALVGGLVAVLIHPRFGLESRSRHSLILLGVLLAGFLPLLTAGLALDAATASKSAVPMGSLARSMYALHAGKGNELRDFSSIIEQFKKSP